MKKFFFVLLAIFLLGCVEKKDELLFYEIIHERQDCKPYCSLEFIVLSNGIVLKKENLNLDFKGHNIDLVNIDPQKALKAIDLVQQTVVDVKDSRCSNCNNFHIFLIKDGRPWMFFEEEEKAPEFIKAIMEDSKKSFLGGQRTEDFFVQLVFKRPGQNIIDYHFFSDGTVLREEFVGLESKLEKAEIFMLSKEKNDSLKSKIALPVFGSTSSLQNCLEKNLEYGYLEIKKEGKSVFVWTCGAENSPADQLFNDLLKEFG